MKDDKDIKAQGECAMISGIVAIVQRAGQRFEAAPLFVKVRMFGERQTGQFTCGGFERQVLKQQ